MYDPRGTNEAANLSVATDEVLAGEGQLVIPGDDPNAPRVIARSPTQIAWRRLRRDKVAIAGAVFIVLLFLFAIFAPLTETITGHQLQTQYRATGTDDFGVPVGPLTNGFLFGADPLSRDLFVRAAFGARTSLEIGILSTIVTLIVALVFGIIAGYYGRWVDTVVSRLIDVVAAFPFLIFAIAMNVVFGGLQIWSIVSIIAFFSWFYPARIFRSDILALREREFVEAARSLGASNWRIMRRHLLPHLMGPLIVYGTLSVAAAIGFEAALSFLGFGLPTDTPSWGKSIGDGVTYYKSRPWMIALPGTLLFMTVLAFNLLGDGLRDAFDPRGGGER
jgi:peptide/nickel transport system permease protein